MPIVGGVSVFNKMFRKTSLDCDISAGHEKRGERERERQSETPTEHHGYRTQE